LRCLLRLLPRMPGFRLLERALPRLCRLIRPPCPLKSSHPRSRFNPKVKRSSIDPGRHAVGSPAASDGVDLRTLMKVPV